MQAAAAATVISLMNINNVKMAHQMCPHRIGGLTNVTVGGGVLVVCSGHTSECPKALLPASDNQYGIGESVSFSFISLTISGVRTKREMKAEWKHGPAGRPAPISKSSFRSVISDVPKVEEVKSVFTGA